MLQGLRALDLTDHRAYFCGRILANLGIEVIKVEAPGGDPGRTIGPFYSEEHNPEQSLLWFAYNLGKKSITLNLETDQGKKLFRRLASTTDFIIESFQPGYMEATGLGYNTLHKLNPGIIVASISPFGQNGPYSRYRGSDIVAMAMGGFMHLTGDPERAPLRINFPLSYGLASIQAALGLLVALNQRHSSGKGQHVDVSVQESVVCTICNALPTWELNNILLKRAGTHWFRGGLGREFIQRVLWPCRDGHVAYMALGGQIGAKSNASLVKWMNEEGMADDFILSLDWYAFDIARETQEFHQKIEERMLKFFMAHTRNELSEGAKRRGIMLQIVAAAGDIMESKQLAARDFWTRIAHPELNTQLTYPAAFLKSSNGSLAPGLRAPLIGENNREIYQDELGLSSHSLKSFQEKGII